MPLSQLTEIRFPQPFGHYQRKLRLNLGDILEVLGEDIPKGTYKSLGSQGSLQDLAQDLGPFHQSINHAHGTYEIAHAFIHDSLVQAISAYTLHVWRLGPDATLLSSWTDLGDELDQLLLDRLITLKKSFFEHPQQFGLLLEMLPAISAWTMRFRDAEQTKEQIKLLPSLFNFCLWDQWDRHATRYTTVWPQLTHNPFDDSLQLDVERHVSVISGERNVVLQGIYGSQVQVEIKHEDIWTALMNKGVDLRVLKQMHQKNRDISETISSINQKIETLLTQRTVTIKKVAEGKFDLSMGYLAIGTTWQLNEPQQLAAWEMYVELATRITTAPLRANEGLIREAMNSLYSLFGTTREILKKYGPKVATPSESGETTFGHIAVGVLNKVLRPFLAKWHPILTHWEASRPAERSDTEHESTWEHRNRVRREINLIRIKLTDYAHVLATVSGTASLIED